MVELRKKTEENRKDGLPSSRTVKSNTVCNFEFVVSHCETELCLQRKKRRQRLKSKLNQQAVQKKEHLNVQVDFQTFLLQKKKKKGRKRSLEQKKKLIVFL